ncbi:cysteine--tRNA ligase [Chloroflexota bacterium]
MKVYNTLSRQKENFLPQGNEVKMYVCGINPYSDCHIGHAMSYIVFDVIRRYLQFRGHKVRHVENITDIEDNIIVTANKLNIPIGELTRKYTQRYFEDMDALNILRAHVYPKATEEIPTIIEIVQGLIDKGYAYSVDGDVYFRVRNVPDYGKLSGRTLESMITGTRIEPGEGKEHPMDFVLWKAVKPNEPSWESPWGPGRPGWHIECSAMSLKYLGNTIDIHGGGQDLIFPHHENEIAQSESFTSAKPFVKYWLHNGLLQMGEEKMSKSLGNLITIRKALGKYSADAIRIFILSSHYHGPLTYSEATLGATEAGLRQLLDAKWKKRERYAEMNRTTLEAQGVKTDDIGPVDKYHALFTSAMDDDFNTPRAISALFNLASGINRAVNLGHYDKVLEHRQKFIELADILGLILPEPEIRDLPLNAEPFLNLQEAITNEIRKAKLDKLIDKLGTTSEQKVNVNDIEVIINYLKEIRNALRKDKQWQLADKIRVKLDELGITLEDTPQGTIWERKH